MKTNTLNKLERHLDTVSAGQKPLLTLFQDLDDKDLYTTRSPFSAEPSEQYRRTQLAGLEEDHQLIVVEYTENWRGRNETN